MLTYSKIQLLGIEFTLKTLENYQNSIEYFLENQINNLQNTYSESELDEEINKEGDQENEYKNFLLDEYSERNWEVLEIFPHNFRASLLIQIISFIESELKKICDTHHLTNKTDFSISDLKGESDIEKTKKYLVKVCKISFNKFNKEWIFIKNCQLIRNIIIHNEGCVSKTSDKKKWVQLNQLRNNLNFLKKEEKRNRQLDEEILKIIIINRNLNDVLLKESKSFFKKLLNTLE